jgi:hypothetical protein
MQGVHIFCKECIGRVKFNSEKLRRDNVEALIAVVQRKHKATQGVCMPNCSQTLCEGEKNQVLQRFQGHKVSAQGSKTLEEQAQER